MSKKTLHGKRHIRANNSVRIGREKRRLRKLEREIKILKYVTSPKFLARLQDGVLSMLSTLIEYANKAKIIADKNKFD